MASEAGERVTVDWTALRLSVHELTETIIDSQESLAQESLAQEFLKGVVAEVRRKLPSEWGSDPVIHVEYRTTADGSALRPPTVTGEVGLIEPEEFLQLDSATRSAIERVREEGNHATFLDDVAGRALCIARCDVPVMNARHGLIVRVAASAAESVAEEQFGEELHSLLHLLTRFCRKRYLRDERQRAERRILGARGRLQHVAKTICETWRDLLGAAAVRLWVLNDKLDDVDEEFDLLNESLSDKASESLKNAFENSRNRLGLSQHPLASNVLRDRRPQLLSNFFRQSEWMDHPNKQHLFRKCPHLLCVPLILWQSDKENAENGEAVSLGILDAYVRCQDGVRHPIHRLIPLSRLTAETLKRAESQELIDAVGEMANAAIRAFAVRRGDSEEEDDQYEQRQDPKKTYLDTVIDIIRAYLHVGCVSIFEGIEMGDALQCCASTGIQEESSLSEVQYRGRGATWQCYKDAKPRLLADVRQDGDYKGEFHETRVVTAEDHDPFLAVPLIGAEKLAIGVIRAVERTCAVQSGRLQNFTGHDRELLELVAYQASSVLQVLRVRERQKRFVASTAHQVIQPLQGIVGYADNILEGVYGRTDSKRLFEKIAYVRAMTRNAARMLRNLQFSVRDDPESLLAIARRADRHEQRLAKYLLDRIIEVQPIRELDNVRMSLVEEKAVDALGTFLVDDRFFDQVLMNLLYNAVRYSYPDTQCEVVAQKSDDCGLLVEVWSTGVPLATGEEHRIFQDGKRGLHAETYDPHGTGQGLFISKHIMRALGGTLDIESAKHAPNVVPPRDMPAAQKICFQIVFPGAFQDE